MGAQQITAWSYSRWSKYTQCPAAAKYKFIDKLPEPDSPASARGTLIHKLAEDYTNKKLRKLPPELGLFKDEFAWLRDYGAVCEEQWAFRKDWSDCGWFDRDTQLRVKIDARMELEPTELLIVDHKTGKNRGGYEEQLGLYGLSTFKKHPQYNTVKTELWFLDSGDVVEMEFDRKQEKALTKQWERDTKAMLTDTSFRPKPGDHCRWCAYSKSKGGPCKY